LFLAFPSSHHVTSPQFTLLYEDLVFITLSPHPGHKHHTTVSYHTSRIEKLTDIPSTTGDQQPPTGSFIQLDLLLVPVPGEDAPT
jgi:hypothetical protein